MRPARFLVKALDLFVIIAGAFASGLAIMHGPRLVAFAITIGASVAAVVTVATDSLLRRVSVVAVDPS